MDLDQLLNKYEILEKKDIEDLFPYLANENRFQFHIE